MGWAAIAQWIRLCLPSITYCSPEFESQAHHQCFCKINFARLSGLVVSVLAFSSVLFWRSEFESHIKLFLIRKKINKKRPRLAHWKTLCPTLSLQQRKFKTLSNTKWMPKLLPAILPNLFTMWSISEGLKFALLLAYVNNNNNFPHSVQLQFYCST